MNSESVDPKSRIQSLGCTGQDHRAGVKITDPRSRGLPCFQGEQGGVRITDPKSKPGLETEGEDLREKMSGN